ncbi:MAG TPA: response regulator [bacterium]|nr:response regulator [bacterium]
MSTIPPLNLTLLQQMTILTSGLKAGLPAETLFQTLTDFSEGLSPEEGALLRQMGNDLQNLVDGRTSTPEDPAPLLRELTRVVNHQIRNAQTVTTAHLQTGEMDLDDLAPVLAAMGDTRGMELLEQVRDRMKRAREGILRASGFLDAMEELNAPLPVGSDPTRILQSRISSLMAWKPETPKTTTDARPALKPGTRVPLLYVEDDPDAGELVALFLEGLDFVASVNRCTSFAGALQVFSEAPAPILVTDYHLEGAETGLDLSRELRRRNPGLKTIITSGSLDELDAQLTAEEKRDILRIAKPFDLNSIENGLAETIAALAPQ